MRSMRSKFRALVAVRAVLVALVGLVGCNAAQVEPPGTATESGDPTGEPATGSDTGDTPTSEGSGESGDSGDSGDSGESGGTSGAADCEGPEGCFDCVPTKSVELLNACGDASCEPFPNTVERLPLLKQDGTLPPLP